MHIEACIGQPYNRIILYRSTRDRLICSNSKGGVQWVEQGTPTPSEALYM